MKPIYSSKYWPKVHVIQTWEPTGLQRIASSPKAWDVREAFRRVKFTRNGYFYKPSEAYFRKISKMAGRNALPKIT